MRAGLLVALSLSSWQAGCRSAEVAGFPEWRSLFRANSTHCEVEVVDVVKSATRFLRCGGSLLGAKFVDPRYQDQSVFAIFAVMQGAVQFMVSPIAPVRVLVLGLGAGTAPTLLRAARQGKILVDTVELSKPVVRAARLFGYNTTRGAHGRTHLRDAIAYVTKGSPSEGRYDLVICDLYTGFNPAVSTSLLHNLRERWLREDGRGVLLLNMVGGQLPGDPDDVGHPHALTRATAQLVAETFGSARAFADLPLEELSADGAGNVLFVGTDAGASSVDWRVPTRGYYLNPPKGSHDWVVKNFASWELPHLRFNASEAQQLASLPLEVIEEASLRTKKAMWKVVRDLLPRTAWRDAWQGGDDDEGGDDTSAPTSEQAPQHGEL